MHLGAKRWTLELHVDKTVAKLVSPVALDRDGRPAGISDHWQAIDQTKQ